MRSPKSARALPPAVLVLLVMPLVALSLAVLRTPAPAVEGRVAGPYAGVEPPRAHAPATAGQRASTGTAEGEQNEAAGGAPRRRDRHRTGARTPFPPAASRPSRRADPPEARARTGPVPPPGRGAPRTAPTLADLQVLRC
ncbi:hypothetical protein [Streptomyces somaliensis]|nr:hypothetical protein [Streptomyces somaliensis]